MTRAGRLPDRGRRASCTVGDSPAMPADERDAPARQDAATSARGRPSSAACERAKAAGDVDGHGRRRARVWPRPHVRRGSRRRARRCCSRPALGPMARHAPGWPRRWPGLGRTPDSRRGRQASPPRPRPTPNAGATRRCSRDALDAQLAVHWGPDQLADRLRFTDASRTRPRTSPTSRPGCRPTCGGSRPGARVPRQRGRPAPAAARSTCWRRSPDQRASRFFAASRRGMHALLTGDLGAAGWPCDGRRGRGRTRPARSPDVEAVEHTLRAGIARQAG